MRRIALTLCLAAAFTCSQVAGVSVAEEDHSQSLQSLLADAREAQSRRDFNTAAELYREATELEPTIPELWANLGLMYHESGKPHQAIQSFKRAIQLNPSLFVPQLFLGIEYLGSGVPESAIPFLKAAAILNPKDPQVARSLGKAYAMVRQSEAAIDFFRNETQLAPGDGEAWLDLGTAYLQQVENDARVLTSTYSNAALVKLRAAESLTEDGKLIQAEKTYQEVIASPVPVACRHAEFGILLLRERRVAEARQQFDQEARPGPLHCGLALLGSIAADLGEGKIDFALSELTSIALDDPAFLRSTLSVFRDAVPADQIDHLITAVRVRERDATIAIDIGSLIENAVFASASTDAIIPGEDRYSRSGELLPTDAGGFVSIDRYGACSRAPRPVLHKLSGAQMALLASCSFYGGNFETTSAAARHLRINPATRIQGLYWESRADQKLAIAALNRAGELDPGSARIHVLLGDVFRQKRIWDDAEAEYRKAVSIDPKSRGARLALAITLFSELKTDEALDIDKQLLTLAPDDGESNLLAGEIFVQRNLFIEAEPYLTRCANLKPELVPRVHALLGKVYAETDRVPAAIAEYKLGLSTDEDGSIHYQLARLYLRTGNKAAAAEAFRESKGLAKRGNERGQLALQQNFTEVSPQ